MEKASQLEVIKEKLTNKVFNLNINEASTNQLQDAYIATKELQGDNYNDYNKLSDDQLKYEIAFNLYYLSPNNTQEKQKYLDKAYEFNNSISSEFYKANINYLNYHIRRNLIKEFTQLGGQENLDKAYTLLQQVLENTKEIDENNLGYLICNLIDKYLKVENLTSNDLDKIKTIFKPIEEIYYAEDELDDYTIRLKDIIEEKEKKQKEEKEQLSKQNESIDKKKEGTKKHHHKKQKLKKSTEEIKEIKKDKKEVKKTTKKNISEMSPEELENEYNHLTTKIFKKYDKLMTKDHSDFNTKDEQERLELILKTAEKESKDTKSKHVKTHEKYIKLINNALQYKTKIKEQPKKGGQSLQQRGKDMDKASKELECVIKRKEKSHIKTNP